MANIDQHKAFITQALTSLFVCLFEGMPANKIRGNAKLELSFLSVIIFAAF
jgi:hypothetical protein